MTIDVIRDGLVVSLAYTLTVDGEVAEAATAEEPFDYLHGAENIFPGWEAVLTGKKVGDKFQVTLPPSEAYGDYDPEDVENVPREDFPEGDLLEPGVAVMMEDEDGYVYEAIVREISGDVVALDFNPPLAGKTLNYLGEVLALREAEDEELAAGLPYGFEDDDDYDDDDYEDEDEE
ncbi:MAG: peptidylprolyl isomerase [Armatimonadetes bacterium]|nr:peptidylprolyl isomerase [Anaerolineae bacterium]